MLVVTLLQKNEPEVNAFPVSLSGCSLAEWFTFSSNNCPLKLAGFPVPVVGESGHCQLKSVEVYLRISIA